MSRCRRFGIERLRYYFLPYFREVAGYDEEEANDGGKKGRGGKLLGGIRGFGAALGRKVASAASKGGSLISEVHTASPAH